MLTASSDIRREKLLTGLGDLTNLKALEVGALDRPILIKSKIDVVYVDYTDTNTLKKKYASAPDHDIAKIVDVDAIWGENTLADALGRGVLVDLVIASHVIEHIPDVITWLQEIVSVLKPNGTVRLAIPDRRYCFDINRHDSTVAELLHSHMVRARKPLPHQVLDFALNFLAVDARDAWEGDVGIPSPATKQDVGHAIAVARHVMDTGEYFDIHCWTFTPLTFCMIMQQLSFAGLVDLYCLHWNDTDRGELEFFVVAQKSDGPERNFASWKRMEAALTSP